MGGRGRRELFTYLNKTQIINEWLCYDRLLLKHVKLDVERTSYFYWTRNFYWRKIISHQWCTIFFLFLMTWILNYVFHLPVFFLNLIWSSDVTLNSAHLNQVRYCVYIWGAKRERPRQQALGIKQATTKPHQITYFFVSQIPKAVWRSNSFSCTLSSRRIPNSIFCFQLNWFISPATPTYIFKDVSF